MFSTNHTATPCDRVLVIGLDGATFDVLAPLAEQGVMPNVATLLRRAALAELRSTRPFVTPVAWTTFQTGADPQDHGIWDYRFLDHAAGQLRLNHAGQIGCPTLFDAVSSTGGEVVSLNLPMTYPAPKDVRGIVVGGLDSPSAAAALAPYPEFARRLGETGADYHVRTIWKRKPASLEELKANVAATRSVFRSRVAAARLADAMVDWRLLVVQFQTLDSLQHRCWHLLAHDDSQPTAAPAEWITATRSALAALDECVGELLELAAQRGAAAVALSDHGFGPLREKIVVPELLRSRGLLQTSAGWSGAQYRASRLGFKVRKWTHRRLRSGDSTAAVRRPLEGTLPLDYRRSRAIALHGELAALVYVNDARRFTAGPPLSPRQREQAAADVIAALQQARHPQTGEALFDEAYATFQRYDADPVLLHWPDVVGIPAPGFQTRTRFDRDGRLLLTDPQLPGTHREQGVLLIDAPGVSTGCRHEADLRDVAPTILRLLGIEPPGETTGRALQGDPAVEAESKNSAAMPLLGGIDPTSPGPVSAGDQLLVEDRLRALGYLE